MNRKIIILTIFIILGMILFPTIYKVNNIHNYKLTLVVEKEFTYYANKCFNEDKCGNIVYLSDLYKENYLSYKLTNPITKKYYEENSYINLDTYEIKLIS